MGLIGGDVAVIDAELDEALTGLLALLAGGRPGDRDHHHRSRRRPGRD